MYIDGRLGLVIDATGRDVHDGISKQYAQLKELVTIVICICQYISACCIRKK